MDRASIWFPILLLVLLAALTYWLEHAVQSSYTPTKANRGPDAVAQGLVSVQTNAAGKIQYRLQAQTLDHFLVRDYSVLGSPELTYYSPDQGVMTVSARTGTVQKGGDFVTLSDHVVATQNIPGQAEPNRIATDLMHIWPQQNLLSAPGPVAFSGPQFSGSALSLTANTQTRVVNLRGRVMTQYLPGHV